MPEKTQKRPRAKQKTREAIATRPSVSKKSPDEALKDLFKEHLGPKSPLIKAFEDNPIIDALAEHSKQLTKQQKDLKTTNDSNKVLVKNILNSSTKLTTIAKSLEDFSDGLKKAQKAPKKTASERHLEALVAHFRANTAHINRLANNFRDVRSTLVKQHRFNVDRGLARESKAFESSMGSTSVGTSSGPSFTPSKGLGYFETRTNQLFGKGFHFLTGALSELINKKILKNDSPYIQENLPRSKQSPQHQSYLRTKDQFGALFSIFDSSGSKVRKTVKTGNEKVTKSVNAMHTTLKKLSRDISVQNQIMLDEAEEAKNRQQKAAQGVVKSGNVIYAGGGGGANGGIVGSILAATKALGEIAAKVIPQVIPIAKSLLSGAKALALRPVGFAAGVGAIGTAAIAAGYYMDKTSRSMMEAQTEELKSSAAVEMQRNRMKRSNPKAYQLTLMKERLGEMKMLPQTPANKKAQDQLFQQYLEILNTNAVTPTKSESMIQDESPAEGDPMMIHDEPPAGPIKPTSGAAGAVIDTIKKTSAIPNTRTATETADNLNDTVDDMHDGVVSELRDGKMVTVLSQIRDGIDNLRGGVPTKPSPMSSPLDSDLVTFNQKSTIASQRESMRSVQ